MRAGLPDGTIRKYPVFDEDFSQLRDAIDAIAQEELIPNRESEILFAWLMAWRHHWPNRFTETFSENGASLLIRLQQTTIDPNRYLKLRRIAIENLAQIL